MIDIRISGNVRNVPAKHVGQNYEPIVIASIGATNSNDSFDIEIKKAKTAEKMGASIITDHTLTPNLVDFQRMLVNEVNVPVSAISVYEASVNQATSNSIIYPDDMIRIIQDEAKRGIDVLTIHATVFKDDIELIKKSNRIIPCTSRGGTMMLEIMSKNKEDNPYWTYFDDVLNIAKRYNITLSLGTCFRPASVYDCVFNNDEYILEINRMKELVKKAIDCSVGIIVEGIGHAPINKIEQIVKTAKQVCYNVPYRVLTVANDISLGYDHISSAIASANAVYHGADMITCVSRSEHIGLPSISDLEEAIISAKIAAYSGYSARCNDFSRDKIMSIYRNRNGCRGLIDASIYQDGAKQALLNRIKSNDMDCSMCGDYCALKASGRLQDKGNEKPLF